MLKFYIVLFFILNSESISIFKNEGHIESHTTKKKIIESIPLILVYSRILILLFIVFVPFLSFSEPGLIIILCIVVGILTDIFDGIIARRLGVSTQSLRQMDSGVDLFFYLAILIALYILRADRIIPNLNLISIILAMEALMITISIVRFREYPSPHAILSKLWSICLVFESILLLLDIPGNHLRWALFFGLFVHIERLLIYCVINEWAHDIPSLIHAFQLRKGDAIKRHWLFNSKE